MAFMNFCICIISKIRIFASILRRAQREGQLSIELLLFSGMSLILITGFVLWTQSVLNISLRDVNKADAFSIAEAGIEYYRWHLAHAASDYWDGHGATSTGPYVHNYYSKNGVLAGTFALDITPPPVGSTVITVKSTGATIADASVHKVIEAQLAIPSIAIYALLSNDNLSFGTSTEMYGQVLANGGIHFDGLAHNIVMSAQASYQDPDHGGGPEFGVHTHVLPVDPYPPAAVPSRPDIFAAGREFPLPSFDFPGLTATLAGLKTLAQSGGVYLANSGKLGYHLVLKTNNTFDAYRVDKLMSKPSGCAKVKGKQKNWELWTIKTETFLQSYQIPANGVVFAEDDVWVDGQINGSRLTIAAGQFPEQSNTTRSIIVNHNLTYTNYDGKDVLGLFAQEDVGIGFQSDDVLRIDAAVIAKNSEFGRFYYVPPDHTGKGCNPYQTRSSLTTYGMIASYYQPVFSYPDDGTGYQSVQNTYDVHLLYNPPPSFPFATSQYSQISWDEIK